MGLPLKAPLTSYDIVYTLPMLTIKEDKGEVALCVLFLLLVVDNAVFPLSVGEQAQVLLRQCHPMLQMTTQLSETLRRKQ